MRKDNIFYEPSQIKSNFTIISKNTINILKQNPKTLAFYMYLSTTIFSKIKEVKTTKTTKTKLYNIFGRELTEKSIKLLIKINLLNIKKISNTGFIIELYDNFQGGYIKISNHITKNLVLNKEFLELGLFIYICSKVSNLGGFYTNNKELKSLLNLSNYKFNKAFNKLLKKGYLYKDIDKSTIYLIPNKGIQINDKKSTNDVKKSTNETLLKQPAKKGLRVSCNNITNNNTNTTTNNNITNNKNNKEVVFIYNLKGDIPITVFIEKNKIYIQKFYTIFCIDDYIKECEKKGIIIYNKDKFKQGFLRNPEKYNFEWYIKKNLTADDELIEYYIKILSTGQFEHLLRKVKAYDILEALINRYKREGKNKSYKYYLMEYFMKNKSILLKIAKFIKEGLKGVL